MVPRNTLELGYRESTLPSLKIKPETKPTNPGYFMKKSFQGATHGWLNQVNDKPSKNSSLAWN